MPSHDPRPPAPPYSPLPPEAEPALLLVLGVIEETGAPYRISGGLAARILGATRPLADIDIEVPGHLVGTLTDRLVELGASVTFGPGWFRDAAWQLPLATLVYQGQEIDIAGIDASTRIFSSASGCWVPFPVPLDDVRCAILAGRIVRVISRTGLVTYKRLLGRPVDQDDLIALGEHP